LVDNIVVLDNEETNTLVDESTGSESVDNTIDSSKLFKKHNLLLSRTVSLDPVEIGEGEGEDKIKINTINDFIDILRNKDNLKSLITTIKSITETDSLYNYAHELEIFLKGFLGIVVFLRFYNKKGYKISLIKKRTGTDIDTTSSESDAYANFIELVEPLLFPVKKLDSDLLLHPSDLPNTRQNALEAEIMYRDVTDSNIIKWTPCKIWKNGATYNVEYTDANFIGEISRNKVGRLEEESIRSELIQDDSGLFKIKINRNSIQTGIDIALVRKKETNVEEKDEFNFNNFKSVIAANSLRLFSPKPLSKGVVDESERPYYQYLKGFDASDFNVTAVLVYFLDQKIANKMLAKENTGIETALESSENGLMKELFSQLFTTTKISTSLVTGGSTTEKVDDNSESTDSELQIEIPDIIHNFMTSFMDENDGYKVDIEHAQQVKRLFDIVLGGYDSMDTTGASMAEVTVSQDIPVPVQKPTKIDEYLKRKQQERVAAEEQEKQDKLKNQNKKPGMTTGLTMAERRGLNPINPKYQQPIKAGVYGGTRRKRRTRNKKNRSNKRKTIRRKFRKTKKY
jgi:hypothetical protein